jgi:hypothetical protein
MANRSTRRYQQGVAIGQRIRRAVVTTALVAGAFTSGLLVATPRVERISPRLVAYGCEGAGGPLWASEEDHLPGPHCDRVERWW